jgi:metal-responsive CopG/Arc/MetJ family transcriptional regulator
MTAKKSKRVRAAQTRRTSVSFPADLYQTLERIAEEQKLSVAWIIRDATEKYVRDRWPLLDASEPGRR